MGTNCLERNTLLHTDLCICTQLCTVYCFLHAAFLSSVSESCAFGSNKYFALCALGGILSCGITHTMIVPLDLVKCRMQVDPVKYKGVFNGFSVNIVCLFNVDNLFWIWFHFTSYIIYISRLHWKKMVYEVLQRAGPPPSLDILSRSGS